RSWTRTQHARQPTSEGMFPPRFAYHRSSTVDDALQALNSDREARVLAGGQSLVPMMSLGVAAPNLLVDINNLPVSGLSGSPTEITVGALTRHRELELSAEAAELL